MAQDFSDIRENRIEYQEMSLRFDPFHGIMNKVDHRHRQVQKGSKETNLGSIGNLYLQPTSVFHTRNDRFRPRVPEQLED